MATAALRLGPGNFLDGVDIHVTALGPQQLLISAPTGVGLERHHSIVEAGSLLFGRSRWRVARLFCGDYAAELEASTETGE